MKAHVKARRERNLELGKQEAAARCAYGNCRKPLPKMFISQGLRFCDSWCQDAEWAWLEAKEARR
jgi:hypothetical protein